MLVLLAQTRSTQLRQQRHKFIAAIKADCLQAVADYKEWRFTIAWPYLPVNDAYFLRLCFSRNGPDPDLWVTAYLRTDGKMDIITAAQRWGRVPQRTKTPKTIEEIVHMAIKQAEKDAKESRRDQS